MYTHSQMGNTEGGSYDYVSSTISGLLQLSTGNKLRLQLYSHALALTVRGCSVSVFRIGDGTSEGTPPAFYFARQSALTLPANTATRVTGFVAPLTSSGMANSNVAINIGKGFAQDGFFAPTHGAYSLTVTCDVYAQSNAARYVQLALYKNAAAIAQQFSNVDGTPSGEAHYTSIHVQTIAELVPMDMISVYLNPKDNRVTMKSCWFSGYRLVEFKPDFV